MPLSEVVTHTNAVGKRTQAYYSAKRCDITNSHDVITVGNQGSNSSSRSSSRRRFASKTFVPPNIAPLPEEGAANDHHIPGTTPSSRCMGWHETATASTEFSPFQAKYLGQPLRQCHLMDPHPAGQTAHAMKSRSAAR